MIDVREPPTVIMLFLFYLFLADHHVLLSATNTDTGALGRFIIGLKLNTSVRLNWRHSDFHLSPPKKKPLLRWGNT